MPAAQQVEAAPPSPTREEGGGDISIGGQVLRNECVATAADGSNCLAMLVRRDGETLSALLKRLDEAIGDGPELVLREEPELAVVLGALAAGPGDIGRPTNTDRPGSNPFKDD